MLATTASRLIGRRPLSLVSGIFATFLAGSAMALLPTPATVVGDVVTHPVTGVDATVVAIMDNSVLTDNDDVIMIYYTVGDTFEDPNDPNVPPATVTITSVEVNATTGYPERYTLDSGDVIEVARPVDTSVPPGAEGAPGDPGGPIAVPIPAGNVGVIAVKLVGSRGADGNDGYGIEICDPTGIFGGCFIIGYGGTAGSNGGTGPTVTIDVDTSHGPITSVSPGLPGITGSSIGGDGGTGGDAYGNFDGLPGGDAGAGGTVTITSATDITTSGVLAHGIFGQSRSGLGGSGGSGYILGGGGTGGTAAAGGTVTITNDGDITTFGAGAKGIYGQSMGGAAGSGGDSWGIVGSGGSSRAGGNGGTVTVTNNGSIITSGLAAHGMLAQSVGGTGGDGGDAGGVVSFGGSGSAGGNGGTVNGNLGATGSIRTLGPLAHGMFVQSVGGGGGDGGTGGGVVAFGGTGTAGGNGGAVNVTTQAGGLIVTEGPFSDALVAQSIGGGGGDGGTSGGYVALGGDGSAAGVGGTVTVINGAALRTTSLLSTALFAQSVGGGGGTARGSGGEVALGGDGGSGGAGGVVNVVNSGRVQTDGPGSNAIVAQSVGGGGGAGGGTGGVVALGGGGGSGGAGGSVSLENHGQVTTLGALARALYAQSVGGGGGFGGDSGGLVAIGGTGSGTSAGGTVTVTNSGEIDTGGARSHAIQAQSIGGGGGDGGTTGGVFFTLGGSGGGGGDGGAVTVNNSGNLSTTGDDARGVFAQSVGGGGGNGGGSFSGSAFAGVAIGGSAAGGGDGGVVTVNSSDYTREVDGVPIMVSPLIETEGDRANGIYVQSVGGGGGNGGLAVQVTGGAFGAVSVAVGGTGGGGGVGGAANLNGNATVTTVGEDADGVVVQSVGGGGGSGGGAISVGVAGGPGAGSVAVGVGGSGGDGGIGGTVTTNAGGNIVTTGDLSEGFIAQSVGGGGGKGGWVVNASVAGSAALSVGVGVGVGGTGGDGGQGGTVDATYAGDVSTSGLNADAWTAQSVGGGGGQGGFNVSGVIAGGTGVSAGIAVGVGGAGGGGGNGSTVMGNLTGDITTQGNLSDGMVVQSNGGGGGSGGFNISGNISAGSGAGGVSVGVGGAGGDGGDGGTASLTYVGNAITMGEDADAILAQSAGGGGGKGAMNVSGSIAGSASAGFAGSVGVGGAGGGGGDGTSVTSSVTGTVTTHGLRSDGVITQSTGGGGGKGGVNVSGGVAISSSGGGSLSIGVGGAGGDGGDGGLVDATVNADVATFGDDAVGVLSQSVGGGGGRGALNVSGGLAGSATGAGAVMIGFGGAGGGGGDAGAVESDVTGDLVTWGSRSDAFVAQSSGGGGGQGGMNISGGAAVSSSGSGTLAFGVGGAGGDGGSAGIVTATMTGDVTTHGLAARGVVAQSSGGGGGNGGINVSGGVSFSASGPAGGLSIGVGGFGGGGGTSDTADLTVAGNVSTNGYGADGVFVQSVGGGGGNGALNVSGNVGLSATTAVPLSVGVGGFGGGGGNGGAALLTLVGDTRTTGANTDAVTIQSVGGGGGKGGINISGNLGMSTGGSAFGASLGLGGFGGGGGDAGNVTASITGDVVATGLTYDLLETLDADLPESTCVQFPHICEALTRVRYGGSNAIIAQSVGGSGGNGGLNVSAGISGGASTSGAFNLGIGGFGGGGGNAGTVNLVVDAGRVEAVGDLRNAVTAQSIGGGGGNGALNVSGGITGSGQVTLGVGGFGGDGGSSSTVIADVSGDIIANGAGARGLLAQSVGGGGGNGGINISGGINYQALIFGLGGFGGAGNISGSVSASQSGTVYVTGRDAIGVLAQSVAGGGGAGALNVAGTLAAGTGYAGAIGIGGTGGAGADAGAVTLTSNGAVTADGRTLDMAGAPVATDPEITIYEDRANGILVQSIGGGGGAGGANVSGVIAPEATPLAMGVGGKGGGGGNAGAVTVTRGNEFSSLLHTLGHQSNGLTVQSIGGGGGDAGWNFVTSLSGLSGAEAFAGKIAIGGAGGDPGHGSTVTVRHTGDVLTEGEQSNGLLAQSIGGGGGNAAVNLGLGLNLSASVVDVAIGGAPGDGGNGDIVDLEHDGSITTMGADSTALFAQSVGGGGGNAALSTSVSFKSSNSFSIGLGRYGGTGGTGGNVIVDAAGNLSTSGDRSVGIFAQSVGGGGGKSGSFSVGAKGTSGEGDTASAASGNLSVGLEGGSGSTAGTVGVDTRATITTQGKDAHAVQAQSVGGGGGVGGSAFNLVFLDATTARVGVGGTGGTGGVGALVDVRNDGTLTTSGETAHGIYAQSVGGGGGTGGSAVLLSLQTAGSSPNGSNNIGVSVGGVGGTGADGGEVVVDNQGVVTTNGRKSYGINAQSSGGGGGDGGLVLDGALAWKTAPTGIGVNVGGNGGTGGDGSTVTVTNSNQITTTGLDAIGIHARSVGGGGGDGGLVGNLEITRGVSGSESGSIGVNVGGRGGTGGIGGTVDVTNDAGGIITTQGANAYGVFAQSVGGGGGNGGAVASLIFGGGGGGGEVVSLGVNVGGTGGSGGVGGMATVSNDGTIDTSGEAAHGIFAQSIGGGGGNGGLAVAANGLLRANDASGALAVTVGGFGGSGGDAGLVTVNNTGSIVTRGANAHGIFAQSVGEGGGNANVGLGLSNTAGGVPTLIGDAIFGLLGATGASGGAGGTGGEVVVNHSGDITVMGAGSQAVKAESINGGGGGLVLDVNGLTNLFTDTDDTVPVITLRAGGGDVIDTSAARVTINNSGTYGVAGNNGTGIGIQSVGGGGGTLLVNLEFADDYGNASSFEADLGGTNGENNLGGAIDGTHSGTIITTGTHSIAGALQSIGGGGGRAFLSAEPVSGALGMLSLGLGADGGTGNHGGDVVHVQTGDIATAGDNSTGFLLQSIGAGGGEMHVSGASSAGVLLGGQNGAAGDGGSVSLNLTGGLTTAGTRSHGVVLQSVGGGGGILFADAGTQVTAGLSSDNVGDGGAIDFSLHGDILTLGVDSIGLLAQSLGGGGGYADGVGALLAGGEGAGGSVTVSLNSSVAAALSNAIYLQSDGSNGGGDISLTLGAGGLVVGGPDVASLVFDGGASNVFTNSGSLASGAGEAGLAMLGTTGDDRIENFGSLLGSIRLNSGVNALTNHAGGIVASGAVIDLGSSGNLFASDGILAPGGAGVARRTLLVGSYSQGADATAMLELDFATDIVDGLSASGSVDVDGIVDLDLLGVASIRPGSYSKSLFSGAAGLEDQGLTLETAPSAVIDYTLQAGANDVALGYVVDFMPEGLVGSSGIVGAYINRVQTAGGGNASYGDYVEQLVYAPTLAAYQDLLTQLSPEFYAEHQAMLIDTSIGFGRRLMSCEQAGGEYRFTREGTCMWMLLQDDDRSLDAHDGYQAVDGDTKHVAVGGQRTFENDWTLGLGIDRESSDTHGFEGRWYAETLTYHLGFSAKRRFGATKFTGALTYGWSDTDANRLVSVTNDLTSSVSRDMDVLSFTLRGQHDFEFGSWYFRPLLDLGVLRLMVDGAEESGIGGASLVLDDFNETHTWIRPALEAGKEFELGADFRLRANAGFGAQWYLDGSSTDVVARFAGVPGSISPMEFGSDLGDPLYGGSVGLDLISEQGGAVKLYYERAWSKHRDVDGVRLKLEIPL